MIPGTCIAIETKKFPVLDGEEDELINEGMYGKALCLYLQDKLPSIGFEAPCIVCEDWGWWIEVEDNDFTLGLCVYSDPEAEGDPERYAIISSITKETKWSWSKFKKVNVSDNVKKIMNALEEIFRKDKDITRVSRHDDIPF